MLDFPKALADSNALAIVVAAAAAFSAGAVWYSPAVFAKPWAKEIGRKVGKMDDAAKKELFRSMGITFGLTVLLSLSLSMLFNLLEVSGLWNGVWLGLFVAAGLTATTMYIHYVYERRSVKLLLINAGYNAVMCVLIGGILGVWPR